MKNIVVALLPLLLFSGCLVQKRKYQKGFYVSRKHAVQREKASASAARKSVKNINPFTPEQNQQEAVTASANDGKTAAVILLKPVSVFQKQDSLCDNILFNDGTELKAKVLEVGISEIRYKKCDLPDGPLYTAKKTDVFMVKYANGKKDVFQKQASAPSQSTGSGTYTRSHTSNGGQVVHPLAVLSLIFGILGIYPLLGLGSVVAILLARYATRKIQAMPDVYKGYKLANAGRILGIIGICLVAFIFLIIIIALLLTA